MIDLRLGDCLELMKEVPSESIDLVLTSPPYWGLRDYHIAGQMGNEPNMEAYLEKSLEVVKEAWRVLKPAGSLVWNLGDCFVGGGRGNKLDANLHLNKGRGLQPEKSVLSRENLKKSLQGNVYKEKQFLSVSSFFYCKVVSETSFVCRGEHVWCKPNVPSPIRCRLKASHEKVFWFVKDADKYYFDAKPWMKKLVIRKKQEKDSPHADNINLSDTSCYRGGKGTDYLKNEDTIEHSWRVVPVGERQKGFENCPNDFQQEHVAPFPEALVKPYIESLCPPSGTVLDPFVGSGTALRCAKNLNRNGIGFDLSEKSLAYARERLNVGQDLEAHLK